MFLVSVKKYKCLVCGNEENHSTNHFGEIYCACRKCKSRGMECVEETAINSRKTLEKVSATIVFFEFDVKDPIQKEAYKIVCNHLKEKEYEKFHVLSEYSFWSAFQKTVKESNGKVEITEPNTFKDQFVSNVGRIHNWYERCIPNKSLKIGYYIIHEKGE